MLERRKWYGLNMKCYLQAHVLKDWPPSSGTLLGNGKAQEMGPLRIKHIHERMPQKDKPAFCSPSLVLISKLSGGEHLSSRRSFCPGVLSHHGPKIMKPDDSGAKSLKP